MRWAVLHYVTLRHVHGFSGSFHVVDGSCMKHRCFKRWNQKLAICSKACPKVQSHGRLFGRSGAWLDDCEFIVSIVCPRWLRSPNPWRLFLYWRLGKSSAGLISSNVAVFGRMKAFRNLEGVEGVKSFEFKLIIRKYEMNMIYFDLNYSSGTQSAKGLVLGIWQRRIDRKVWYAQIGVRWKTRKKASYPSNSCWIIFVFLKTYFWLI